MAARVGVFISDNVVFSKVATSLYLNQDYRDFAGVLHAMLGAEGDENGMVFADELDLVVDGDFNDYPMFGAVVIRLERQRSAWVYVDTFHLKTLADHEALEPAPWAVVLWEGGCLRCVIGFERVDGLFDVLSAGHVRHEDCVIHRDGHDVLEADADDFEAFAVGTEEGVFAVNRGRSARGQNTVLALGALAPDRVPSAKIRPAAIEWHDREVGCLFHDRVVNRDVVCLCPSIRAEAAEAEIDGTRLNRALYAFNEGRGMGRKGVNDIFGFEEEDACIPKEGASFDHLLSTRCIRLFNKAL